jgi:hypothetical protein
VPSVRATASASALRLSDTVEVTLTVTGTAPLRVELPKELLDPASAVGWQITPAGAATVSPDGTTWTQKYTLSPFVPGESLVVRFNPIKVNGTDATPNELTFKVETSLRNATAADARPVTGVETLPPPPPAAEPPLVAAGLAVLSGLVVALAVVLAVARKRTPKPLTPGEWVRERVGTLQSNLLNGRLTGAEFVECLATAFREYLTRRFGLNTEQKTTAELLASAGDMWDADTRGEVAELLTACDAVKFAGRVPTPTDCDDLTERVSKLVDGWERPVNGAR